MSRCFRVGWTGLGVTTPFALAGSHEVTPHWSELACGGARIGYRLENADSVVNCSRPPASGIPGIAGDSFAGLKGFESPTSRLWTAGRLLQARAIGRDKETAERSAPPSQPFRTASANTPCTARGLIQCAEELESPTSWSVVTHEYRCFAGSVRPRTCCGSVGGTCTLPPTQFWSQRYSERNSELTTPEHSTNA
jgi:hypothetical protein